MRVPGRAKPARASSAAIRSRSARWAGLGSMRHTVSDPRARLLSTVYSCGQVVPGRPHAGGRARGSCLYRAVAAVAGVATGGGVRPGRDRAGGASRPGAGEEPAVGGRETRRLRGVAGPGADAGGGAAPVGGRAVHPVRARFVQRGAADAAHEPAVHRAACCAAAVSGRRAAAPGTVQAAVPSRADRRVSRARGRSAHRGTPEACGGAGLPGRRERPDLRRGRSGPPEHHEPADHRAGRRRRAAPAGYQPAARHLAARYRRAAGAGHLHARGRDQLLPAARRRPAMIPLAVWEQIIDASGAAPRIEALQPIGVRARQLKVRTLLAGMCLAQADHRPAHLTRVHQALTGLTDDDQRRLGVVADSKHGPHLLTYRQTERTSGLVAAALGKDEPGGLPSQALRAACDDLPEASVPGEFKDASTSLAVDRTDMESFSRPPPARGGDCAGPEASRGHRKNNLLRREDELFFGYHLSAAIMMPGENGPAVPELARRAIVSSCRQDPVRALVPVLTAMPSAGIPLGDVLADSGYAHRDAAAWALPLRDAGASR